MLTLLAVLQQVCVLLHCAHHQLHQGILVPHSSGVWKLAPSHSQVPRVADALLILGDHVLCLSALTIATGLVSCPTFPQHGEVRD